MASSYGAIVRTGVDRLAAPLAVLVLSAACAPEEAPMTDASVTRAPFGTSDDGRSVHVFTLTNANGVEVRVMEYGATIVSLRTPDRDGNLGDIALGFDSLDGYLAGSPYFGAVVGRYGNRIAGGRFALDDSTYQLATNDGVNHLHGGITGFDKVVWTGEPVERDDGVGVTFAYTSPDGEEGYPGTLETRVTYILTEADELIMDYVATTDRATPVNLTQHTYFNLTGDASRDILDHELQVHAESFTPVDETLIPTGTVAPVAATPFDFRSPTAIGARIGEDHRQLELGGGYDHNFVLRRAGPGLISAAQVVEPTSGRMLEVLTTEPGMQFYSGNFLDGTITGKGGRVYEHRFGFCLETQHYPDSPNQPEFPSTILRPGDEYRSTTVWRFGVVQ
jgi:aldose 1-epimerase